MKEIRNMALSLDFLSMFSPRRQTGATGNWAIQSFRTSRPVQQTSASFLAQSLATYWFCVISIYQPS